MILLRVSKSVTKKPSAAVAASSSGKSEKNAEYASDWASVLQSSSENSLNVFLASVTMLISSRFLETGSSGDWARFVPARLYNCWVDQRTLGVLEFPKVLERLAAHTSFSLGRERAL